MKKADEFSTARSLTLLSLQTNPLLIRVETKAGHGAGKPTSKAIEENADSFCFLVRALRMEFRRQ